MVESSLSFLFSGRKTSLLRRGFGIIVHWGLSILEMKAGHSLGLLIYGTLLPRVVKAGNVAFCRPT